MAMVLSTQCRLVGALCVALMALSGLLVASLSGWLDPHRNKRALDDPELKVARLRQPEFEVNISIQLLLFLYMFKTMFLVLVFSRLNFYFCSFIFCSCYFQEKLTSI